MTHLKKILSFVIVLSFLNACQRSDEKTSFEKPTPPIADPPNSTEVGNGGDLIQCSPRSPLFPYSYKDGWYVLDYAELRGKSWFYIDLPHINNYLTHIETLLEKAGPKYAASFKSYLSTVPFLDTNRVEPINNKIKRTWVEVAQVIEVHDENPLYIPSNCRRLANKKSLNLHQVVVRYEFTDKDNDNKPFQIVYAYDPSLIDKIGEKYLQVSMLVVHEWLWDFYEAHNSRLLRRANRLLHAENSSSYSPQKIRDLLGQKKIPNKKSRARK